MEKGSGDSSSRPPPSTAIASPKVYKGRQPGSNTPNLPKPGQEVVNIRHVEPDPHWTFSSDQSDPSGLHFIGPQSTASMHSGLASQENYQASNMSHLSAQPQTQNPLAFQSSHHMPRMPFNGSPVPAHSASVYNASSPRSFPTTGPDPMLSPSSMSAWLEQSRDPPENFSAFDYMYRRRDPRQPQFPTADGFLPRPHDPQPSSANMDPNSFRRLSNDQSHRRPNVSHGHRQSVYPENYRHSSDDRSNSRFPPEMHNKRFFSDQPPFHQLSSLDSEPLINQSNQGHQNRRWSGSRRPTYENRRRTSSNSGRNLTETFIPEGRNDINSLVLLGVSSHISNKDVYEILSRHTNVTNVHRDSNGGNSGSRPIFVQ